MTAVWMVLILGAFGVFRHLFSLFRCLSRFLLLVGVVPGAAVRPSQAQPALRFSAGLSWLDLEMGVSL